MRAISRCSVTINVFMALTLCVGAVHPLGAQSASGASAITPAARLVDSARVSFDRLTWEDSAGLTRLEVLLDRTLQAFPGDPYVQHYRGLVAYRAALVHIEKSPLISSRHLQVAADMLNQSSHKLPWAETPALLATVYGLMIGLEPARGMELGQQIGELQAQAMSTGAGNPRVALIIGQALVNTPAEWGGGVDKGLAMIRKSLEFFQTYKPAPLAPTWGRDEAAAELARLQKGQ